MSAGPVRTAGVVAAAAVAVGVEAWSSGTTLGTAWYLVVLVGAGVAAWFGVRRWPPERRLVPRLIAAGISLNAVGEVVWTALGYSGLDTDVSVADLAWVASYVVLCAALWVVLSRTRGSGEDLSSVLDAVTVVVVSVLVFWRFSIDAIVADDTLTPLVRVTLASYPVLDAVLLALVVRLLAGRSRSPAAVWFAAGLLLWLTADVLYLQVEEPGALQRVMDVAWMLAPVLMARAAWPSTAPPTATATATVSGSVRPDRYVATLLLAVCPLMVPPALELVADLRDQPDRTGQLLVGTVLVVLLALVRTGRLVRAEQHARRELVAARDAALAASEAKSIFLSTMSHEFRTPLAAVLASGELLAASALDAPQLRLLDIMRRSGSQLHDLVEDILDFSILEAGDAVAAPAPFHLPTLAGALEERHGPRAAQKGLTFAVDLDPRVRPDLVGDLPRLTAVLDQLVGNAVKFTETGGVTLSVRPTPPGRPRGVLFAVVDTGIGIDVADQERVFATFEQVDGTPTRRYGGTGLGLAICRRASELMGGTITLRSRLGDGSTFTVWLPLTPAPPTTGPPAPVVPAVASSTP